MASEARLHSPLELQDIGDKIMEHLQSVGSPIMVGGDGGGARTVLGIESSRAAGGERSWRFCKLSDLSSQGYVSCRISHHEVV